MWCAAQSAAHHSKFRFYARLSVALSNPLPLAALSCLIFTMEPTPIFSQKLVDRCHILLPDTPTPTSAIYYEGRYFSYVRFFPSVDIARQKADLLMQRGNAVLLTRIPKGLVLWVYEPDAQPVGKFAKYISTRLN